MVKLVAFQPLDGERTGTRVANLGQMVEVLQLPSFDRGCILVGALGLGHPPRALDLESQEVAE
jgi:hypothetical protein